MLRERAARGAGHLFLGNAFSQIVQGVGLILVARLLGATDYGLYTLMLVPSATFYVFTRIGFGAAATRYVAYYNALGRSEEADSVATSTLLYVSAFYALVTAAAATVAPAYAAKILHQPSVAQLAKLACITIFFQGLMTYTTSTLNGYYKTIQVSAIMLIQAVTKTVLSVGLILLGLRIYGALVGTILSFVFSGVAGVFWLLLATKNRSFRFEAKTFRRVLSFGLPLYAANILNGLSTQVQLVILASVASAAAVGAFTATQNLAVLVSVVVYPITTMAGVAFSEVSAQNNSRRTASSYVSATKIATTLVVPAAIFLIFVAKPAVSVLYGSQYVKYYLLLAILAAGYLSVGIGGQTQTSFFGGLNNTKLNAFSAGIGASLLLALSFLFGLRLGVFGVALATSLSAIVTATIIHRYYIRGFGVELPKFKLVTTYIAAALSATPLLLMPQKVFHHGVVGLSELILILGLYVVIYSTLLPLLKGVNRAELDLIAQSLRGIPVLDKIVLGLVRYAKLFVR